MSPEPPAARSHLRPQAGALGSACLLPCTRIYGCETSQRTCRGNSYTLGDPSQGTTYYYLEENYKTLFICKLLVFQQPLR